MRTLHIVNQTIILCLSLSKCLKLAVGKCRCFFCLSLETIYLLLSLCMLEHIAIMLPSAEM